MKNQIIQEAVNIGHKICKTALWQDDKCTWLSKEYQRDTGKADFRPQGTEFYKGLSGTAFFLCALYAAKAKSVFKRTALGALRQAILLNSDIEEEHRFSFFRGQVGLLYVLLKSEEYLGKQHFTHEVKQLLQELKKADIKSASLDVIEGLGSGIPALLFIAEKTRAKFLLDKSEEAGQYLLSKAEQYEKGISWKTSTSPENYNLPGFSHGTAGIAHALLRLYQATKNQEYLTTALAALNYEKSVSASRKKQAETDGHPIYQDWAHGNAGRSLAYLSAGVITKQTQWFETYRTCLEESLQHYQTSELNDFDLSITNGLWASIDAGLEGSQVIPDFDCATPINLLTNKALSFFEKNGNCWGGSNKNTEEVPDFMISLGGIGYSLLRINNPRKFKSILCL